MQIRINNNNTDLWCLYHKEQIEIGEKYIEIKDDDYEGSFVKTYKYFCMDMLVDEHLENYGTDMEIFEEN